MTLRPDSAISIQQILDGMRRLLEANFHQTDDGLAETLSILEPLGEAWNNVCHSVPAAKEEPEPRASNGTRYLAASAISAALFGL